MWKRARIIACMSAASLTLAIGCSSSMMSGWDAMRGSVSSGRAENQAHLVAVRSADSLPAVAAEMNRHDSALSGMMADMDGAMGDMQHCTGPGMPQMTQMRGQMTDEMSSHDATMRQSVDLTAAQAEAERHGASMGQMLDGMDGALGNMDCGGGMH